jgi:quercetin dioxygenase-like cupin family protein
MLIVDNSSLPFEEFAERGARDTSRKTLVLEKLFRLRYYKLSPGGQTPFDVHDYEHVVVVVKGEGTVITRENDMPRLHHVKAGTVLHIKSREPHQFVNTGEESFEFYCFSTLSILYTETVAEALARHG